MSHKVPLRASLSCQQIAIEPCFRQMRFVRQAWPLPADAVKSFTVWFGRIVATSVHYTYGIHHSQCPGHPIRRASSVRNVLGAKLRENQQVIIQVISVGDQMREAAPSPEEEGDRAAPGVTLPDWCNVYEGLSDEEISGIESVVLDRSGWTRNPQ